MELALALVRTQEIFETCLESDLLRMNPQDFTRNSPLSAPIVLQVILHRIYHSLQLTLDSFFSQYDDSVSVTKQAFSAARKKLNPEFVRLFADMTSEIGAMDKSAVSYKGMPLIAIDGSYAALENTPELLEDFGGSGPKKNAATALISIAYAPLNHIIYDCRIDRYETDERILAKAHVSRLLEMGMKKSLLLFDRWYPSAEFIAFLHNSGFHFVMRVREKFNTEADEIKTQGWISLEYKKKKYPVRVLKVTLPNGEIETLLTSLNQKKLPIREAGNLYFERWKVETAYETLKSKLELENLSGKKNG